MAERLLSPDMDTPPHSELLSPMDSARYLGISQRTLDRYQADGLIQPLRTPGGRRRFQIRDLDELKPKAVAS